MVDFAEIVHATVHKSMMMRGWGPTQEQGGETWGEGRTSGKNISLSLWVLYIYPSHPILPPLLLINLFPHIHLLPRLCTGGRTSGGGGGGGGGGGEILEQQRLYAAAEVCRVFLACLMLANTGNLDVIPPDDNHDSVKDDGMMRGYGAFAVRMLETTRKKNMDDFLAPSIADELDQQHGRKTTGTTAGTKKSKKTARNF